MVLEHPWRRHALHAALGGGFLACIPLANWLVANAGTTCIPDGPCLLPMAPGLMAPSGVVMIGVALALRDEVQERMGHRVTVALIGAGAVLSLVFAPAALSVASATSFFLSEMLDFAVYARLRRQSRPLAVLVSGIAGAIFDSFLFCYLAFGNADWVAGLFVAKLYGSAAFALWLSLRHRRREVTP